MTNLVVAISDVHGAGFTLTRLLNQVAAKHPGARLISCGDEIDRGPHSRAVVEFMMGNGILSVQSNHVDLCLAYSAHTKRGYKSRCSVFYDRNVWLDNGGSNALSSWRLDSTKWGVGLPKDVLDWMQALPAYIIPDAPIDENGHKLFLSHTGYGLRADDGDWFTALWGRRHEDGPFVLGEDGKEIDDGAYRVFGHSPCKEAIITPTWANIDSGALYSDRGGGILTAFLWPTKETITQPYDESPVEQRFSVVDGCLVP